MIRRRNKNEEKFHDHWAETVNAETVDVRRYFTVPTASECQYALKRLGNLRNKRVLDLGCGFGEASIWFALQGAEVIALDVSEKMLKCVNILAKRYEVSRLVKTLKSPAEKIPLTKNSIDIIYGGNVLHHTDVKMVSREIRRILKPEGKAVFIEPLAYNPLINIYRIMAKGVRTKEEKPFTLETIQELERGYRIALHKEFQLFTTLIFVWFFLVERLNPSKERYWKKYIEEGQKYSTAFNVLSFLDNLVLKVPFMRRYCWNTVIELVK